MMRPPLPPSRTLSSSHVNEYGNDNDALSSEDESINGEGAPYQPPRPSMVPARRRRRSSVSHRLSVAPAANVNELYQKAIRLNAENKINLTNSWNLKLIEHMDQVLEEEDESTTNFTKASCTLDASVKIYGYRVDDVHLTSYKVLANLNRSDKNKKRRDEPEADEAENAQEEDETADKGAKRNVQRNQQRVNTLEEQSSNINLSNLDSIYDVDPLFHKMSAAFDEGGAKGLLLVNLGMGDSCNIVFDSRTETDDATHAIAPEDMEELTDIQSLRQKLEAQLLDDDLHDLPLVPQLTSLRAEHGDLVDSGYCDAAIMNTVGPKTPGRRRYKASNADEALADRSIHEQVRGQLNFSEDNEDAADDAHSHGAIDFGTNDDFGGDDEDHSDILFDNFMENPNVIAEPDQPHNEATQLLDAIASGTAKLSSDNYAYFTDKNQWAGAGHWKKNQRATNKKDAKKKTGKKNVTKSKRMKSALVSFDKVPDVSKYLKNPKTATTWTNATVKKNTKEDNVLPIDSNITLDHLTMLFLRPEQAPGRLLDDDSVGNNGKKKVSFGFATTWDDVSVGAGGDDDNGPGYEFAGAETSNDDQDFYMDDLPDVRKVQRIQVGYASVAKKVDVKKLKQELWAELESRIQGSEVDMPDLEDDNERATLTEDADLTKTSQLSFQDVLKSMEDKKSQPDVTLPFYFICTLHLANEKGFMLNSQGLDDFTIAIDHSN